MRRQGRCLAALVLGCAAFVVVAELAVFAAFAAFVAPAVFLLARRRRPGLVRHSLRWVSSAAAGITMCTWGWKSRRRLWVCSTPTAPGVAPSFGSLRLKVAHSQAHCISSG